jgi:hypothetical protein
VAHIMNSGDAYATGHRIGSRIVRRVAHEARKGTACAVLRNDAVQQAYDYASTHPSTAFAYAQVQRRRLWYPWNRGIGDAVMGYLRDHGCPEVK